MGIPIPGKDSLYIEMEPRSHSMQGQPVAELNTSGAETSAGTDITKFSFLCSWIEMNLLKKIEIKYCLTHLIGFHNTKVWDQEMIYLFLSYHLT